MKSGRNIRTTDKSGTLTAQIRETERRIMRRQHRVNARTDILIKDLYQQMTTPSTLLLTGGIGFIVGELTKPPPKKKRRPPQDTAARPDADMTTPLKKAVSFMSLLHSLYQALPLVWIMNTFFPDDVSKKAPTTVKN